MCRKWKEKLVVVMFLFFAVCMVCSVDSQAAKKKNKVTWKLEKGTLTVYGKGKMPKSLNTYAMKKKQRKKVKRVVIKKGVTTVSDSAFEDMENLKTAKIPSSVKKLGSESFAGTAIKKIKVPSSVRSIGSYAFSGTKLRKLTIPGNFKFIPVDADATRIVAGDINIFSDDKLIVTFNTKLKLDNTSLFVAKGYVVSKKDPKYCSVDGCIYTKDKKSLVRVPMRKKKLNIIDECTEFCTQSVLHGIEADDGFDAMCDVSELIIPSTVTTVNSTKYHMNTDYLSVLKIKKLTIRTKQLDGKSLAALVFDLNIDEKELMRQLPGQVIYRDGKYYSKDGVWLRRDPYKNWNPTY